MIIRLGYPPCSSTGHPDLVSCLWSATPGNQSRPAACGPAPRPPGPSPSPPGPPPPPPAAFNCSVTAYRADCNCSGHHPPFGPPARPLTLVPDLHYPTEEDAERASLEAVRVVELH